MGETSAITWSAMAISLPPNASACGSIARRPGCKVRIFVISDTGRQNDQPFIIDYETSEPTRIK